MAGSDCAPRLPLHTGPSLCEATLVALLDSSRANGRMLKALLDVQKEISAQLKAGSVRPATGAARKGADGVAPSDVRHTLPCHKRCCCMHAHPCMRAFESSNDQGAMRASPGARCGQGASDATTCAAAGD